jgi:transcriptional repressor of cell division inhibition gene dicB
MRKEDVLKHFGSVNAVASALGIKGSAVSQWGDDIPPLRAYEIERITNGALTVEPPPPAPSEPLRESA